MTAEEMLIDLHSRGVRTCVNQDRGLDAWNEDGTPLDPAVIETIRGRFAELFNYKSNCEMGQHILLGLVGNLRFDDPSNWTTFSSTGQPRNESAPTDPPEPPTHPAPAPADPLGPLAVDAAGAARMFSVSLRSWRRWESSGRGPRGFRLGRRTLWRIADLRAWASTGFPRRGGA